MPECEGAKEMFDLLVSTVERSMSGHVFVLTHALPNTECYAGKFAWLQKFTGSRKPPLMTAEHKALLAKKDRILIDDMDKNISPFTEAGGHGVLIPRPWNTAFGKTMTPGDVVSHVVCAFNAT
jgi:hypothetical protein